MAFYHTYRPQDFSSVVNQKSVVQTLTNEILRNRLTHAYLFTGPRGTGKTSVARILAKAISCPNRKKESADPCTVCGICQEIRDARHMDIIEIDAASYTGVEMVREHIINNAQFHPTILPKKIFIIDEVHMLSTSAFNALLKTLEEPPAHVIFILATTELRKVPETILSRCQIFRFTRVSAIEIKGYLETVAQKEDVHIEDTVLNQIVRRSGGCVRDAVSLLEHLSATPDKVITEESARLILSTTDQESALAFVEALAYRRLNDGLGLLDALAKEGGSFFHFGEEVILLLRLLLIVKSGAETEDLSFMNPSSVNRLYDGSAALSVQELIQLIDRTLERVRQIKQAPLPQLPLEMLTVEWCDTNETLNVSTPRPGPLPPPAAPETPPLSPAKLPKTKKRDHATNQVIDIEETPPPKETATALSNLLLTEVEKGWKSTLQKMRKTFPALVFIFEMLGLKSVTERTIVLTVPYAFHKETMEKKLCIPHLITAFQEYMDGPIEIAIMIDETLRESSKKDSPEVRELIMAFGGESISP